MVYPGFDIVHIANPPDCLVPVTAVYKMLGKRIIYDQHDLSPELYVARFSRSSAVLLRLQLWLELLSYKLADHVIVTNESYREVATSRGRQPETKVTVVRNGPELEQLQALRVDEELRQRSRNIIAFAGITGYQDGLDYLCEHCTACAAIWAEPTPVRRDRRWRCLPDIKKLSQELGIEENIWFVGWVSDLDTYFRYLSTADICVAPEPSNQYNDKSTFVKSWNTCLPENPLSRSIFPRPVSARKAPPRMPLPTITRTSPPSWLP